MSGFGRQVVVVTGAGAGIAAAQRFARKRALSAPIEARALYPATRVSPGGARLAMRVIKPDRLIGLRAHLARPAVLSRIDDYLARKPEHQRRVASPPRA